MVWRTCARLQGFLALSPKERCKRLAWIVSAWVVMSPILAFIASLYLSLHKWPPTFYERRHNDKKCRSG